jgi:hypothetical protein
MALRRFEPRDCYAPRNAASRLDAQTLELSTASVKTRPRGQDRFLAQSGLREGPTVYMLVSTEEAGTATQGLPAITGDAASSALIRRRWRRYWALRRSGALAGRGSSVDTPAAMFTPSGACTHTGCMITVRSEPPTRTLALAPAPTVPPAVAPV